MSQSLSSTLLEEVNILNILNITNISGLRPFVRQVVDMRTEAKRSGDDAKSLTAKLFGNSSYGKCGESVEKYRNTVITSDQDKLFKLMRCEYLKYQKHSKYFRSPLQLSTAEILDEDGELLLREVTSLPAKAIDSKPVHVSVAILQHAKILFLRFMWFLFDHLEPGSFRTVYADTDR